MSRFLEFVAEGFGLGRSPAMPGTVGTAVLGGLSFWFLASSVWTYFALFWLVTLLGLAGSNKLAVRMGKTDPGRVVIDEWSGYLCATLFLPANIYVGVAAFVLFRIFDVLKPQPARWAESLPGSWGIMTDDVIAGIYTNLILQIAVWVIT